MDASSFSLICQLSGLPNSSVALDILRKLAADVEPLFHTHKWRPVPCLYEIYPTGNLGPRGEPLPKGLERIRDRLGGYTHPGREICLVLRDEGRSDTFIVYAQLLDTFLHELAHQSYGNHGPGFSKMWTSLQQEYLHCRKVGLLGTADRWKFSPRAASWTLETVSYGVGIPTSGAFRINNQTSTERVSGALHLAPTLDSKRERKIHFSALEGMLGPGKSTNDGESTFAPGSRGYVLGSSIFAPKAADEGGKGAKKRRVTKKQRREILAQAAESRVSKAAQVGAAGRNPAPEMDKRSIMAEAVQKRLGLSSSIQKQSELEKSNGCGAACGSKNPGLAQGASVNRDDFIVVEDEIVGGEESSGCSILEVSDEDERGEVKRTDAVASGIKSSMKAVGEADSGETAKATDDEATEEEGGGEECVDPLAKISTESQDWMLDSQGVTASDEEDVVVVYHD